MLRSSSRRTQIFTASHALVPWRLSMRRTPSLQAHLMHRHLLVAASCISTSVRGYCQPSRVLQAADTEGPTSTSAASSPPSSANNNNNNASALDVAMQVNRLKRLHQSSAGGANKADVEMEAWAALNALTEEQINNADGKAVSLLLNSWAYFAKFWAKGKDGPMSS